MIEVYVLFPTSIMIGFSVNEIRGFELFLGLIAISFKP